MFCPVLIDIIAIKIIHFFSEFFPLIKILLIIFRVFWWQISNICKCISKKIKQCFIVFTQHILFWCILYYSFI